MYTLFCSLLSKLIHYMCQKWPQWKNRYADTYIRVAVTNQSMIYPRSSHDQELTLSPPRTIYHPFDHQFNAQLALARCVLNLWSKGWKMPLFCACFCQRLNWLMRIIGIRMKDMIVMDDFWVGTCEKCPRLAPAGVIYNLLRWQPPEIRPLSPSINREILCWRRTTYTGSSKTW